jgi:hypothetical protein
MIGTVPVTRDALHRITLRAGEPHEVPLRGDQLTSEERRRLESLCVVAEAGGGLRLLPKSQETVGTVQVRNYLISVSPRWFKARTVLGMILAVYGVTDEVARLGLPQLEGGAAVGRLAESLAALLVVETERALRRHVAQAYLEREEPVLVLRGRPLFGDFGRSTRPGFTPCRYEEKSTDILANRLLLSGARAALGLIGDERLRRRGVAVVHSLDGLAREQHPTARDYDKAFRRLNRQSVHYADPLRLARAVTFGYLYGETDVPVPGPVFEMWRLFQEFVGSIVSGVAPDLKLRAVPLTRERVALVDRVGRPYRDVVPDMILKQASSRGLPLAVIDAKYKPVYLDGGPGAPPSRNRILNGDIYQVLFYAEDLRVRSKLARPLPAAIVAPLLDRRQPPGPRWRTVRWPRYEGAAEQRLRLLACPVEAMVERWLSGGSAAEVASEAPELQRFLRAVARRGGRL